MLHRLVAETFIANPENKLLVNHKNGNKLDYRIKNLEWATHSENTLHAYEKGLICRQPKEIDGFISSKGCTGKKALTTSRVKAETDKCAAIFKHRAFATRVRQAA